MKDQEKKYALITGGSGAIGSAICRQLATQNFHVLVHANQQPESAAELVKDIIVAGGSAEQVQFDLIDQKKTYSVIQKILKKKVIQVVVHAAGIHDDAPLAGMKADQWHRVIDVSLHGFYHVVQPLLLPMIQTRWGRIISLSSVSGVMGNRGQANYAAAKAGLHGASQSLALELASRGITVNVVAPGIINTPLLDEEYFTKQRIKQIVPMQRMGEPEEVASLVNFLASPQASYISGQVISINGAMR